MGRLKEILGTVTKKKVVLVGIATEEVKKDSTYIIKYNGEKRRINITSVIKKKMKELTHEEASQFYPEVEIPRYNKQLKKWETGYRKAKRADVIKFLLLKGKKEKKIWLFRGRGVGGKETIKEDKKIEKKLDENFWDSWSEERRLRFLNQFLKSEYRNREIVNMSWEELTKIQRGKFSRFYEEMKY